MLCQLEGMGKRLLWSDSLLVLPNLLMSPRFPTEATKTPDSFNVKWKSLSGVRLFAISWTIQSMEFSRGDFQPFPSPGDLPNPGIEPRSVVLQVNSLLTRVYLLCLWWVSAAVCRLSLVVENEDNCLVLVYKLLIAAASLVAEHGL